ncbi:MAG: SIS domain-containing protein [Patescibacteria group bacterium]|nr:SIS domain-containing protein [Patescibacteria group bacterium]
MDDLRDIFKKNSAELQRAAGDLTEFHRQVLAVVELLRRTFAGNHRVFVAGNGGSATQAQHLSDELVGRFRTNRRPYPVIALTADSAVLTCIGNDFGFEKIFSRQLEALGAAGDVFVGLSTSGESPNILEACSVARQQGMKIVALTGPQGKLSGLADLAIIAPTEISTRMQELHLHAIHLLCEAFENDAMQ